MQSLFSSADLKMDFSSLKSKLIISVALILLLIGLFLFLKRSGKFKSLRIKVLKIKDDFVEGFKTITMLKGMWIYILETFLILGLWLLMFYVIFFAYTPTKNLTITAAVITYAMGTLAYLLPIQAGIGVWHLIIIQCLLLFGIDRDSGMMFALVAHTFSNLIYLVFGAIGLIMLPIINNNNNNNNDHSDTSTTAV